MAVNSAFDAVVEHYDQWIAKALPGYGDLFAAAVSIIPFEPESLIDVLDLGAGTGLFSYHVWSRFKRGRYVLYDSAPKMLDAAKERFADCPSHFAFEQKM